MKRPMNTESFDCLIRWFYDHIKHCEMCSRGTRFRCLLARRVRKHIDEEHELHAYLSLHQAQRPQ